MKLAKTAVLAVLAATGAYAQTNLGAQKPEACLPFVMTKVATFNLPWRLAFLPDGRMLITEKVGPACGCTKALRRRSSQPCGDSDRRPFSHRHLRQFECTLSPAWLSPHRPRKDRLPCHEFPLATLETSPLRLTRPDHRRPVRVLHLQPVSRRA
jgi:Glucose / Sorbosone dehydrogenase